VNAYFGVYIALPVNPEIIAIEVLGGGADSEEEAVWGWYLYDAPSLRV